MRWIDTLVEFAQSKLTDRELEILWGRGVSDEQIREYKLGYVNARLPPLEGAEAFLDWCWQGRKLEDMFVLPMTNSLGQVKGVQFRHVERHKKGYTDYLVDKEEPALFGLAQAMPHVWQTQWVVLVEGAFDLFPVQRVLPNVIPTMTASVSLGLLRFLRRNVREIWLMYDTDKSGYEGARAFVAENGQHFKYLHNPGLPRLKYEQRLTKDPAELWEVLGDERFGVYLRNQATRLGR